MTSPDSTNPPTPQPGSPERPPIDAGPGRSLDAVAAEHVVQGLLEFMNRGDIAAREGRVARVLDTIAADESSEIIVTPATYRFPRSIRWVLAAAALIALCASLVILGVPGESSALAEVRQVIVAMQSAGERRYEIRRGGQGEPTNNLGADSAPDAIVDSAPGKLLIRHKPPWSRDQFAFAGRDNNGPWAIRGGTIIRANAEDDWPPYITDGGESFMLNSVDGQLAQLPSGFAFDRLPAAAIDAGTKTFDRIRATRTSHDGPMPNTVELWIDPASHLVERVEYHWDGTSTGSQGKRVGAASGPGPPGHRDHHDHEDIDRPGPPPDDMDAPPHDHGPHGPDDHGGPSGPGGPPHHHDDDAKGEGPGHGRAGTRMISFQRIDAPAFPTGWFTPESHLAPAAP